jgi:hypothetical protein
VTKDKAIGKLESKVAQLERTQNAMNSSMAKMTAHIATFHMKEGGTSGDSYRSESSDSDDESDDGTSRAGNKNRTGGRGDTPITVVSEGGTRRRIAKEPTAHKFSGGTDDKIDFEAWYDEVKGKLKVHASYFIATDDRDEAEILWVRGLLEGEALKKIQPYLRDGNPARITTTEKLLVTLKTQNEDPNKYMEARKTFRECNLELTQDYMKFYNEFVSSAAESREPAEKWKDGFYERLNNEMLKEMSNDYLDDSVDFDAFHQKCLQKAKTLMMIRNRNNDKKKDDRKSDKNKSFMKSNKDNQSKKRETGERLNEKEMAEYRKEGRCYHCHKTGHAAWECPLKEDSDKKGIKKKDNKVAVVDEKKKARRERDFLAAIVAREVAKQRRSSKAALDESSSHDSATTDDELESDSSHGAPARKSKK